MHTAFDVLFICKDQNDGVLHFAVGDNLVQLAPGLVNALSVSAVHHKDESLRAREVVAPEWPDLVLAADVLRARESRA